MELCRLVYISDATRKISSGEIRTLTEQAKIRNEGRGVTGLLLYSGGHFMQVLEGEPRIVISLYEQIALDKRHANHRVLFHKTATYRMFPEWGMQLMTTDRSLALDRERIDKTILRMRMSSGESDASESIALMQEFRQQFLQGAA